MTEVGESRDSRRASKSSGERRNPVSRLFGSLGLFISQILDELWNYTLVVIVFVTVMMALVSALDFGFGKLVALIFGDGG